MTKMSCPQVLHSDFHFLPPKLSEGRWWVSQEVVPHSLGQKGALPVFQEPTPLPQGAGENLLVK